MARDHRKLRMFVDAHHLTLAIYQQTREFPRDEWYALRLQLRKAAVSVPSNIVEGSARRTTREYMHFLNVARGSAAEASYLLSLASDLGYRPGPAFEDLNLRCEQVCKGLAALLRGLEPLFVEEDTGPRTRTAAAREQP